MTSVCSSFHPYWKLAEIMVGFPLFFKFSYSVVVSYCECGGGKQTDGDDDCRREHHEVDREYIKVVVKAHKSI